MALKIRRGTEVQRSGVIFDIGEIVWTTDAKQLWIGDGVTQGGVPVVGESVAGYGLSFNNTTKRVEIGTIYTDDITESPTAVKKFFTQELAQDAAALLLTTGIHSGVSVQYDDLNGRLNLTVDPDDIGLTDIINDTTPQLGGDLDLNTKDITGTGNIEIAGTVYASSGLGGDLILNTYDITGTGNISITGFITDKILKGESISPTANKITIGTTATPTEVFINAYSAGSGITINGYSTGGVGTQVIFNASQGSISAPSISLDGDILGGVAFRPYNGTSYIQSSSIVSFISDSSIAPGNSTIESTIAIGNDVNLFAGNGKYLTVAPDGAVAVPSIQTGVYTTTPSDNRPVGVKGMIIFNDTSGKFQGYNGTTWVDLS